MKNKTHRPTPRTIDQVDALLLFGANNAMIARTLKIDMDTLRKHYRHSLENTVKDTLTKIAMVLYKAAANGDEDSRNFIFGLSPKWKKWKAVQDFHLTVDDFLGELAHRGLLGTTSLKQGAG